MYHAVLFIWLRMLEMFALIGAGGIVTSAVLARQKRNEQKENSR